MRTPEVLASRPFRLALAFAIAISIAMACVFGLVYLQVSNENFQRVGAILVDEAEKSVDDDPAQLKRALKLRLTRDIRRLDYVGLFDDKGALTLGNVSALPDIPIDGSAHFLRDFKPPSGVGATDPALFVARRRGDGGVLLLGRNLGEIVELQQTVLRALVAALLPTILAGLGIGAFFARRASVRLQTLRTAMRRVMNGDFATRLPSARSGDDIDRVAGDVNVMLDEIERLLDQLRGVGDSIAHDLRTPLSAARAKLDRVLGDAALEERSRAPLEAARTQLDRAAVTIGAILRISAVENGPRDKRFRDFDLAALCVEAQDFFEPAAQVKRLSLHVDAQGPVIVRGDEDLMREALFNLIDNAVKFTPPGGEVRVETTTEHGHPIARVRDTGPGVAPEDRKKIFSRFYRGANGAAAPGHGLGLNIAEMIAKLHGFELVYADSPVGACFEMRAAAKASLLAKGEQD